MEPTSTRTKRRMVLWGLLAVSTGLLVIWMVGVTGLILQQSNQNGDIAKDVRHQTEAIESCTTPGGKCYEQGGKRTAEAIQTINEGTLRMVAAALSCEADGIEEQEALVACTIDRLEQLQEDAR